MQAARLLLAVTLPWLAAVVWLRGLWHGTRPGTWPALLGYGYVTGMLGVTLLLRGLDAVGIPLAFWPAAAALAVVAAFGVWRWRKASFAMSTSGHVAGAGPWPPWEKSVFLALCAAISLRLLTLGAEALTAPLLGWDAWATWAPRARVWYEMRRLTPFVDWGDWLRLKSAGAYTISAAHYPPAVSLLQTWTALAAGGWDDSLIGLPWLGCATALGLAFYGQARLWGATSLVALTFTYLLLSLPILDTQVALPGSADLWMASVYGLAAFSFCHWLRSRDARQGCLALGLALACALIKVPGTVWMLTFVPALMVARLGKAAWLLTAGVTLLALGVLVAAGGFATDLPGLGVLGVAPGGLDLPYLGHYPLAFRADVFEAFGSSLFSLASWHLLFHVLCGIALVRLPLFARDRVFASMAALAAAGFAFVGGVYFLTPLAEFALDYTQLNRTLLHMVPMLVFVALAAWVGPDQVGSDPPPQAMSRGTHRPGA